MLASKPIRYFVAVAEERHFSRAANRLAITQSALSVQIRNLEEQLGTRLLNRSKRSAVTLTTAGTLFLKEAKIALERIEHAEQTGRRAGRGEIGHVNIGYVASAAFTGVLPGILHSFRSEKPEVTLSLEEIGTPRQLDLIANQQLDIGFLRPRPEYPKGIEISSLHSETFCVAMPSGHSLARKTSVSAKELKNEVLIEPQFEEPEGFEHQARAILGDDVHLRNAIKVRDFLTATMLVSAGYGVALVPQSVKSLSIQNLVFLPLENDKSLAELVVAYREDEQAEAVLALIKQAVSKDAN